MNNSALLIIDMQNVYLPENEWACDKTRNAIKYIEDKIKDFPENHIFFIKHIASKNPKGVWEDYNNKYAEINSNEYLCDYVPELKKYITNDNLFIKSEFSALSNKNLLNVLSNFDTIYITGVVAECCILSTIFDLIDMGKKIVYCSGGIAGKNEHKENSVKDVLEELSPLHVIFE